MSTDLNQDGDTLDRVLHAVDLATGATTDLGLACIPDFAFDPTRPDHAVAHVGESSQGNQDLNGDGDRSDAVSFDVDLAAGSTRSSRLAHPTPSPGAVLVDGNWAALNVSESAQGAGDLNGDGVLGNALFAWDLGGTDDPLDAGLGLQELQAAHQSFFLFTVGEANDAQDRNGDGDANDAVLHAYQAGTGAVTNIGLAGEAHAKGLHSVLIVYEGAQRQDLNGDGDQLDSVPHAFSLDTGAIVNTRVALHTPIIDLGHGGSQAARRLALDDDGVAFHVSEIGQGGVDLNGDGDELDDDILFVHLFETSETRNLRLSVWDFELADGLLAMQVGRYSREAHVHDLARNTTWDLGVPSSHLFSQSSFVIRRNWVAMTSYEAGIDHTGDGEGTDWYLVLADVHRRRIVRTGIAFSLGYPLEWSLVFNDSGALTALAYEREMAADLNGDGDTSDQVVQVLYPELGLELNTGASAFALMPGYRQTYPFTAREADDGLDHNGDGDAQDGVLRAVRVKPR